MNQARPQHLRLFSRLFNEAWQPRFLHLSAVRPARVFPNVSAGPPPKPPTPIVSEQRTRASQRPDVSAKDGKYAAPKKRFWQTVSVRPVGGALEIYLDERQLRHPRSKSIIRLPVSKPSLAVALALEWDQLTSVLQATKDHLVPLTSLICRALDIEADDRSDSSGMGKTRSDISTAVLKYLDTDTLLCWAPPAGEHDVRNKAGESLRDVQKRFAGETVSFLTTYVWPGVTIEPVLDGQSFTPRQQAAGVREIVQGWVQGLSPWELAGLERAVLAGKSLVIAARLVAQWSEESVVPAVEHVLGVEEAAKAVSIEVDWQTDQWGEVEDTHDVNHQDLRRQLGSVVLLVSGTRGDASAMFKHRNAE
ncbi:hypothetical protein XA68_14883 [Ophiocordyceps unilateralis]|uniref:ATP synthase mitochondrial F1 complex assembly factor 2 n=1 Tax=Ophiocordyceps unilateralis TaxID=268505 RepID=A0A2A9P9F0_OPHUN|nr:hypothetical protein XA68_14883 [Ophiocordyceps unilateralis]